MWSEMNFLFLWGDAWGVTHFWGKFLAYSLLCVYFSCLLIVFFYSLVQLKLARTYKKYKKGERKQSSELKEFPYVTVQIPLYNEMYVAKRAIENIAKIDYPLDKLQVQILDDSTDETSEIVAICIAEIKLGGLDIEHRRRQNRVGYKAGALDDAMPSCKGEFIAIFDVDFLPHRDFLLKTIGEFKDDNIGLVQTKWGHINKNFSILTQLQAFGLNAHFSVEQVGRNQQGHYINFNGTGGVWRKSCIIDAGGWQHDTLTEDLDLSYRAQVKGWEFSYLENVIAPAELPISMSALKSQQHRWMKGGAECFVKNNALLRKSDNVEFKNRIYGLFHLFNSSVFVVILLLALSSLFLMTIKNSFEGLNFLFNISGVFLFSTVFLFYYYWLSYQDKTPFFIGSIIRFTIRFTEFLVVSLGLTINNSVAVLEGYAGQKSSFVRTPKFNINAKGGSLKNKYDIKKLSGVMIIEFFMFLLFSLSCIYHFKIEAYAIIPFHLMLSTGFGFVFYYGIKELKHK